MDNQHILKKSVMKIRHSVGFKIITIFVLILALLVPTLMIQSLIYERENRKEQVVREISSKWGQEQTIAGPIITIPYKKYFEDKKGKITFSIRYMHFLPEELRIQGKIFPEIRYRGIYEAVLYNARLELSGTFPYPEIEEMNIPDSNILWSGAFISLGISDMRGIQEQIDAKINGSPLPMNPGIETNDVIGSGISAKIPIPDSGNKTTFSFALNLNGSHQIHFIPVGQVNTVSLSSSWASPSFAGGFIPVERKISGEGFQAKWKVLHLNRNYPQYWTGNKHHIQDSAFGVKLFVPVDVYQKSTRTAKYAIMFR